MIIRFLTFAFAIFALASTASADIILTNDFEGGQNTGNGANNNGTEYLGSSGEFVGLVGYTEATAITVGGFEGSATAVNFVPGASATYDGLIDIPTSNLAAAGFVFDDPSLTTTISFDYEVGASTTVTSYNGIVGIANTDGGDGNTYQQGAAGEYFGGGAAAGTAILDVTDLLTWLDPAVNPGYTTLRLLSNTDGGSTLDITIDNIVVTQISAVPEPGSACVLLGLGLVSFVRRRR